MQSYCFFLNCTNKLAIFFVFSADFGFLIGSAKGIFFVFMHPRFSCG